VQQPMLESVLLSKHACLVSRACSVLAASLCCAAVPAGFFGLGQQPPWASGQSEGGAGPAFGSTTPFTGGGNFVFGAPHGHTAEAEMET
jgi:hypothetical protein